MSMTDNILHKINQKQFALHVLAKTSMKLILDW